MKRGFKYFLILVLILISIAGCDSKKEVEPKGEEKKMEKTKQDLTIIEQDENGEITKGTIEGFTFVETEKESDRIKIQMENGDVILAVLSNSEAPITIKNFKSLVKDKFYDGIIFHRVIEGFMIQGGDPTGTGMGGSDNEIKGEFASNGVKNNMKHERGVLSMARSSYPDSASSQFFIMHENAEHLDGDYAAFGKVFAGMDAVDAIATQEVDYNDKPIVEQKMKSVRFITIEK